MHDSGTKVLTASANSKISGESALFAQTRQNLRCSHTQSIDEDKGSD